MHETARNLMRLWDYDGAILIVDRELDRCSDLGSSTDLWHLRFLRADLTRLRGHTEEALAYLAANEADFPPDSNDLPSLIGLKNTRGYCLGMLGKFTASDGLLKEAELLAREAGPPEWLCEVWRSQAWFSYVRHDFATSDLLFRQILQHSEQAGEWYFRAIGLWGVGKNLMMQGHINSDPKLLKEALNWFEKAHDLFAAAGVHVFAYGDMAVCHLDLGDDQKSLDLLEELLPFAARIGWVHSYQVTIANIGNVFRIRGDYLRAIEYYRCAVEYAEAIRDPVSIKKWTQNIHLSYHLLGQSIERLRSTPASV
ncbi:MAG: tetratricopeptide repeat protein [Terracidiphilus sp.]